MPRRFFRSEYHMNNLIATYFKQTGIFYILIFFLWALFLKEIKFLVLPICLQLPHLQSMIVVCL